jgi:hypothetical protein
MEDMNYPMIRHDWTSRFSYPKFFYYLLSPEFIEVLVKKYSISFDDDYREYIRKKVSEWCTEYQSW